MYDALPGYRNTVAEAISTQNPWQGIGRHINEERHGYFLPFLHLYQHY